MFYVLQEDFSYLAPEEELLISAPHILPFLHAAQEFTSLWVVTCLLKC